MNAGGPGRTNSFVKLGPLVSLALACAACQSEPARPPPLLGSSGALGVRLENHLGWPYRLERILVVMDGAVLYERRGEIGEELPIADLSALPAGEHTVQVLGQVRYPSGTAGDACILTLKSSHSFLLRDQPSELTLDMYSGGPAAPFDERVRLAYRMRGSEPGTRVSAPDGRGHDFGGDDTGCRGTAPLPDRG